MRKGGISTNHPSLSSNSAPFGTPYFVGGVRCCGSDAHRPTFCCKAQKATPRFSAKMRHTRYRVGQKIRDGVGQPPHFLTLSSCAIVNHAATCHGQPAPAEP